MDLLWRLRTQTNRACLPSCFLGLLILSDYKGSPWTEAHIMLHQALPAKFYNIWSRYLIWLRYGLMFPSFNSCRSSPGKLHAQVTSEPAQDVRRFLMIGVLNPWHFCGEKSSCNWFVSILIDQSGCTSSSRSCRACRSVKPRQRSCLNVACRQGPSCRASRPRLARSCWQY